MKYFADNNKLNNYVSGQKKDNVKGILLITFTLNLVFWSSYYRFENIKILFYVFTIPTCLFTLIASLCLLRVSYKKVLDTVNSLNIDGNKVEVSFCKYRLFHRKNYIYNLQDSVIKPSIHYYKEKKYLDSYSLQINVKGRRLLVVKDFFPDFDAIEKEFKDSGVKFLPQSYEVKRFLKKQKK